MMLAEGNSITTKISRSRLLLFLIVIFAALYRTVLVLHDGFPPGADIGLHNSLIHSITQGGNTNFLYNYYHMGGGNSITFPGFDIFVSNVILFTGLPDFLAQAFIAILFSSLLVPVAFLITRKIFNESVALIVAFLVGVSYYDIYMLLWSGYANIVTLMLIPLTFYLLLEKFRFQRLPCITAASLLSASIFLTHSLSALMFIAIISTSVGIAFCFPRKTGVGRREVLEWLVPLFIGGLVVSPFLVQVAPFYLNLNSPAYTGGLPDIQKLLLPMRLIPVEFVLPFFVCCFLSFLLFKHMHRKILQLPTILLILWLIISTTLTQSYIAGFYTDYERFLYFANLPLIILVGIAIFLAAHPLAENTSSLLSKRRLLQKSFAENKVLTAVSAVILILVAFFWIPHLSMTPAYGFYIQDQQQVMTQPGYDAIHWIQKNTPEDSVFVADALYGWWLGGAQRPTVSAVEPIFLTNSREFEPAEQASRLLDTDYLVDNGLIQIREDGGYISDRNPDFLVKLNNSYYPFSFLNFNSSQTTVTFGDSEGVNTVKVSELPVREMHFEHSATSAAICITRGNEFLNLTQKATVYQGIRFVNMTETLTSNIPIINLISINFTVQTSGTVVTENGKYIGLMDPNMNVAGQIIFTATHPTVMQASNGRFQMLFNLSSQPRTDITFYITAFECPSFSSTSAAQTGLKELFFNNTKTYADKVGELPLDIFDYRQAIADLNVSYLVVRDDSQIPRFSKDPVFSLIFVNKEVAIFEVHRVPALIAQSG